MEQSVTTTRKSTRFSRLKVGIAAVAIGALLVVPAASANDVPVEFEITGGEFSATLSETAVMGDLTFDHVEAQTSEGTLNIALDDARGTTEGWGVSLVADDFVKLDEGLGAPIPAEDFSITHLGAEFTGDGEAGDVVLTDSDLGTSTPVAVAAEGGGAGTYAWDIETSLAVPAGQQVGTYQSTVTMTTTPDVGEPA